jgi:hypothetical protein
VTFVSLYTFLTFSKELACKLSIGYMPAQGKRKKTAGADDLMQRFTASSLRLRHYHPKCWMDITSW